MCENEWFLFQPLRQDFHSRSNFIRKQKWSNPPIFNFIFLIFKFYFNINFIFYHEPKDIDKYDHSISISNHSDSGSDFECKPHAFSM